MDIKNTLKSAGNLRFGAEFRMDKLYLRGGYGYYGKAFKTGELNEDLDHSSISFGRLGPARYHFVYPEQNN